MEQDNAYKQEVFFKKNFKTHNAVRMSIVQLSFEILRQCGQALSRETGGRGSCMAAAGMDLIYELVC